MWRILVTPTALRMLEAIPDRRVREKVAETISDLSESPELKGKPLVGELAGYRSLRAAGQRYRVIYKVEQDQVIVVVVAVGRRREGDRKDVYALAKRLFEQRLL